MDNPQLSCRIVIPARFASTRFPGKPLAKLRGADGTERTLIERSWLAARAAAPHLPITVATDDHRIVAEVERFGGQARMTPPECRNGTERCAALLADLPDAEELIINLQGDAPLTPIHVVQDLIASMSDPSVAVATPAVLASAATQAHLRQDRQSGRVGGTTVVFDRSGRALYFSKEVLPFAAPDVPHSPPVYLHLGVYAYRGDALRGYSEAEPDALELSEGLEQLRFLANGIPVRMVVCPAPDGVMAELNNPEDVPVIEAELRRRGLN